MRILIDECVDPRIKRLFAEHETATVHEKKWDTLDDGALLAIAHDQFDVLLTIDRGLEFQQNIAKFRIGVLVIHVLKNQIAHFTNPFRKNCCLQSSEYATGNFITSAGPYLPNRITEQLNNRTTGYSIGVSGSINGQIATPQRYTAAST